MKREWLLLTPLARFGDAGLLLLRLVTGAFLVWQSHDNILSAERMKEFEAFLAQFRFPAPEVMAPLCVWAQFLCGIAFILGSPPAGRASSPPSPSSSRCGWCIGRRIFRTGGRH